jgi:hypothetical protein
MIGNDAKSGTELVRFPVQLANTGNTATKNFEFIVKRAVGAEPLPEPWAMLYRDQKSKSPPTYRGASDAHSYM